VSFLVCAAETVLKNAITPMINIVFFILQDF
jgi:hypothetical protein